MTYKLERTKEHQEPQHITDTKQKRRTQIEQQQTMLSVQRFCSFSLSVISLSSLTFSPCVVGFGSVQIRSSSFIIYYLQI